ncbi:MAG: hypothetical protein K0R67_1125 [Paenibacillus sp.]|nr:hypothetical protein [Paenibacillus sp.]
MAWGAAMSVAAAIILLTGCMAKPSESNSPDEVVPDPKSAYEVQSTATPVIPKTPQPSPAQLQLFTPTPTPTPAPAPVQTPVAPVAAKKKPSIPVQHQQEMMQKKLTLAELRSKYSDIFKVQGSSKSKRIALTFDDGPDDHFTPQVLDVLKAAHVKATFFLVGRRAETHPSVVNRIVKEGHVIGNHSYNHPLFTKLSLSQYQQQINDTSRILNAQIGYSPKLIRPPYGEITEEQLKWTGDSHLIIVNWNVDSLDWKGISAEQVTRNILTAVKSGAIVLQHSAGGDKQDLSGTVGALSIVISKLKADGYEFVTVPQLLNISKQQ